MTETTRPAYVSPYAHKPYQSAADDVAGFNAATEALNLQLMDIFEATLLALRDHGHEATGSLADQVRTLCERLAVAEAVSGGVLL